MNKDYSTLNSQIVDAADLTIKDKVLSASFLSSVMNGCYVVSSINDTDNLPPTSQRAAGDVAIVSAEIDNGIVSRTAYYWDGINWIPMDGNYNASNVYFDKDLMYTTAIGALPAPTGYSMLPAAGKSLEEVLNSIMVKAASGTPTRPSVTFNFAQEQVQFGETVQPTYDITFNNGSYQYPPRETGIALSSWRVSTNGNQLADLPIKNNITNKDVPCEPAEFVAAVSVDGQFTVNTYNIIAYAGYEASTVTPSKNNGEADPDKKLPAGEVSFQKAKYAVSKPTFYKITTSKEEYLQTADTASLTAAGWTKVLGYPKTEYECTAGWYQILCMIPSGIYSSWKGTDLATQLPAPVESTQHLVFTHLNNATELYDLFIVQQAVAYSKDTTVSMEFEQ